jgi:hypothetical protein
LPSSKAAVTKRRLLLLQNAAFTLFSRRSDAAKELRIDEFMRPRSRRTLRRRCPEIFDEISRDRLTALSPPI